jgi:Sec-independent protein translocase protein TatA
MRLGIWELLIIVAIIALLFNSTRLARLVGAFRRAKTAYRAGLEEPVGTKFRDLSEEDKGEGKDPT